MINNIILILIFFSVFICILIVLRGLVNKKKTYVAETFKSSNLELQQDTSDATDTLEDIDDTHISDDHTHISDDTSTSKNEDTFIVNSGSTKKNSKIGSSLDFAYILEDENNILSDKTNPISHFPAPAPGPGPKIPITLSSKCENEGIVAKKELDEIRKISKPIESNLYDKELEPKPSIDSPYGFVFFPNKYWKSWSSKAPVCVPTSKCLVQPTATSGVPVDVLDYTQIGSIMPKFEYKEEYD